MKKKPRRPRIQQISFVVTLLVFGMVAIMSFTPFVAECARDKQEQLDLSILDRQAELAQRMNRSERLQLAQIESAINQAQSDLRSGQFMTEVKYSPMKPDRDVGAVNKRGKKIIAEAQDSLYANQKALVKLLEGVDTRQKTAQIADETIFDLELDASPYAEALQTACQAVMEASWQKSYEALFFHEPFIRDGDGIRVAGSDIRNEVYDTIVAIDGTNFTLTLPVDFRLKADTLGNEEAIFAYENASSFERDKKALLVVEIILPEDSSTGLLFVRAIDLATQRIAAAELIKVVDIEKFIATEDIGARTDRTMDQVKLSGAAGNIQRAANLPEPYRFKLQSNALETQMEALITQTLLRNSELFLVDSDFIREAYVADLSDPENWQGLANGRIVFVEADSENTFELGLQVRDNKRTLPAGTATVSTHAADDSEDSDDSN